MWRQFERVRNHLQSPSPRITPNVLRVRRKYILINGTNADSKNVNVSLFTFPFPGEAIGTI